VFTPDQLSCTRAQRGQAWCVHVFTAFGVVVAMLALRDVLVFNPGGAIIWLMVTLVIDGVDGPIARALVVKDRAPRIDGYVLDLIIDYVTCVIVPAAFMYQFNVLPSGDFGLALVGAVVFTSAIWFSRTDMMTSDNWFRGFPAAWNLVAPVLYLMQARTSVGAVVTIVLCVLSLTNAAFPHIMRAQFLRTVTLPVATIWVIAITVGAAVLPKHPWALRPLLDLGSVYFIALTVVQTARTYRHLLHRVSPAPLATGPASR
jgi:phosphatidylcholine synthase